MITGHGFIKFEDTTEIPELVSSAYGKVLELGPAVGNQLQRFQISKIEHIYGVEANKEFEKDLREKVETLKIGDKYTPIMCKLEDVEILREYGVKEGSMDCIVSIQVLCSVSDVEKAAKVLYRLLKPGGQLIFWEHQRSSDRLTRFLQKLWNIPWTLAMDGCHLDNEIEKSLLDAGSWIGFGLDRTKDPYDLTPRVWGKLTKAGD
ncbi:S-adenosyl-L-methionine-dependent methyltransferase [Tothia fuscella]|uniref:S-adenosyl-L-methionine-dependent methyltransferase n=1 Tax=Tothia fuscella TaxID=1048955 RepID=A0A9P4NYU4_9PEZI|nr:S-adenosyl-L-methionine-dependent methyltransferase [Tothia fuscella]